MFRDSVRHRLTRMGELTAHPAAFGIVLAYAIAWLIFSPATFGWGAIATLATWMKTELTRLDQQDVEEIVAHRSKTRRQLKARTR